MSHSDDRRRRLLSEDPNAAESPRTRSNAAGPPLGYAEAARRQHQSHVTDLVPLRGWLHALLFLSGSAAIGAVVSAYWFVPGAVDGRWPLLDLAQDGSLAAWLGAAWLACAAPLALVIFAVRRHRLDDYRGRYRMWLYLIPALLWLSLEQTAALHSTVRDGLETATGWAFFAASAPYWPLTLATLLGALGVRLAFETRRSKLATAGVVAALLVGFAGLAVELDWIALEAGRTHTAVLVSLQLCAVLLLLASLGVYARQVILAAEGQLTVRVKKPRMRAAQAGSSADEPEDLAGKKRLAAVAKVDPPQGLKGPITARTDLSSPTAAAKPAVAAKPIASLATTAAPARTSAPAAAKSVDPDEEPGPRKLTKAERKALKRRRMSDDENDDWWERGD
ncbi:MAG: hypothetical protein U0836_23080 [Pirellulales bacterium]